MKKIVIITPSLAGGGAEKIAVNLANEYASRGHNVELVLFKAKGPYLKLVNNNVALNDLDIRKPKLAFLELRKYLRKNRDALFLSVIRTANIHVGLASIGLGLNCLIFREANTLEAVLEKPLFRRFLSKSAMALSYYFANGIIANSPDTKNDLIKNKITWRDKVAVIPNPVLPSGYQSLYAKEVEHPWFNNEDFKVVLAVGRLHKQKNFSFLISAFKYVLTQEPKARLLIIGEGDEEHQLINQITSSGMKEYVKLEKFKANVFPYYYNAHLFALSSDWEGFGNVLVEALAAGLPIVSTNCNGGPKFILADRIYGTLVSIGDARGFANAILEELQNTNKKLHSIEYSKNFTVDIISQQYLLELTKHARRTRKSK